MTMYNAADLLSLQDDKVDAHALVVTRDGTVLVRSSGNPDDTSWGTIATALLAGTR